MATTDLFTDVELITTGTGGFSRDSWKALLPGLLSLCSIQSSLTIFMTHIHLRFEDLLRPFPSVNSQHHLTASASIEKALFVHGDPLTRRPDPEAQGLDICRTIFPDKIYYAINVHAWPPSNLIGQFAYSGEDNSSTTFVFYPSSGSISSIFDNHLRLSTASFAWSGVDEQASEGWARLIKRLVIANPFSSSSKPITVKKKSNHAFVILLGFASIIKISGGFTEIYVSNFMYLSCLKNLPVNLPELFLSPSPFSSEEKTLPPFPLPLERDDSSASLPSVCFSFFIGLLSCGAVSTGPEDATEITSIMGNCLAKPPPVVLVPPLFDYPPLLARNRMLESSYDFLFGKLALKCLFEDYFEVKDADHFSAKFMLKPTDDPHVDLVASVSSVVDAKVEGDASFRWQRKKKMENSYTDVFKSMSIPVTLKGTNYLLWSRLVKTPLVGRGLWEYVPSTPRPMNSVAAGEGKTLGFSGCSIMRTTQDEAIKRSDLNALIKALKENSGNTLGLSLNASYKLSNALVTTLNASDSFKPVVIDSGASHHMISDARLISNVKPALGNVMIANGDSIPIKGVGNLKLFEKDTKAFYMPSFASNLLSVKKVATDLNCKVIFSPNDVVFQDIETLKMIGKDVTKGDLYQLEDTTTRSCLPYAFSSIPVLENDVLWHARLGHPHSRALNLVLRVRSSGFYPKYGIGAFLVSPLISKKNDKLSDEHGIMGLSYASTNLSLGAIVSPFSTKEEWPKNAWLVRKMGRLTVGVQYEPLCGKIKDTEKYRDLRNWSCAANYGLGSRSPLNPSFNVGLELTRNSQFIASFYQHLVIQRVDDSNTSNSLSDSSLQMAASWQANKNFLLKGKVGALSSTFTLAFKSWWNPSFTFNITATNNHRTGRTACGFGLRVDNLREAGSVQSVFICFHISMFCIVLIIKSPGICSYQRADSNFVMLTPNKEHLAEGTVRKMGERPMFLSKL
ncbi:unnamed protein product [Brassica oleracea]